MDADPTQWKARRTTAGTAGAARPGRTRARRAKDRTRTAPPRPRPPPHRPAAIGRKNHGRQGEHQPRGRRQGSDGRPALIPQERGAGRPQRLRQDHPRRGARPHRRRRQPRRRVEDGTSLSDHDDIEHRQQRSVQLSLVPLTWDDCKINLLDAPGYADFVGELRAGLRAADAALFVVSAAQEADAVAGSTRLIWEECAAVGMPRGHRRDPSRHRPHRLRAAHRHLRGDLRRRRPRRRTAPLPARPRPRGRRRTRAGHRARRAPHPEDLRLLHRGTAGEPPGRGPDPPDPGGAQPPHRRDHRRERGRVPHGPLPRR